MYPFSDVESFDPEIAAAITAETNRQRENIELIASENLVSKAVMSAMGSTLTNKYAEGYPGKRYYGGCQPWNYSAAPMPMYSLIPVPRPI